MHTNFLASQYMICTLFVSLYIIKNLIKSHFRKHVLRLSIFSTHFVFIVSRAMHPHSIIIPQNNRFCVRFQLFQSDPTNTYSYTHSTCLYYEYCRCCTKLTWKRISSTRSKRTTTRSASTLARESNTASTTCNCLYAVLPIVHAHYLCCVHVIHKYPTVERLICWIIRFHYLSFFLLINIVQVLRNQRDGRLQKRMSYFIMRSITRICVDSYMKNFCFTTECTVVTPLSSVSGLLMGVILPSLSVLI